MIDLLVEPRSEFTEERAAFDAFAHRSDVQHTDWIISRAEVVSQTRSEYSAERLNWRCRKH